MDSLRFEPRYTTGEIPGKCIKCLAEQELYNCVMEMMRNDIDDRELRQKFEMLVVFLKSPESKKLLEESEKLLSEGKRVTLKVNLDKDTGKLIYELSKD